MARPSKFTPEVRARIIQALQAGNYQDTACAFAGIAPATYYRWMADAELPDADKELVEFREEVIKARAEAEIRNVAQIQLAAQEGTWQAAAWYLERSHPNRWGRYQRVDVDVTVEAIDPEREREFQEIAHRVFGLVQMDDSLALQEGAPESENS